MAVETDDPARPWYGRLLLLFDVRSATVAAEYKTMALIYWLEDVAATHVPDARTFRYCGERPDAVDIACIKKPVRMATSPRLQANGEAQFVLLPYGKANTQRR